MTQRIKIFASSKTYAHNVGLSCCFRQWRATSHCRFLHGYALQIKLHFAAPGGLDERNWVVDFGSLKEIKRWLEDTFDHKTLVAQDDPEYTTFQQMHLQGLIDMVTVESTGCEKFAEMILDEVHKWLESQPNYAGRVSVTQVDVNEHEGNGATCVQAVNLGGPRGK